jgi:hypothetical protein
MVASAVERMKTTREPSYTVFLSGLPLAITDQTLRSWLEQAGLAFFNTHVLYGKCCAYIHCRSAAERDQIIERYHNSEIQDFDRRVRKRLRAEVAGPRGSR